MISAMKIDPNNSLRVIELAGIEASTSENIANITFSTPSDKVYTKVFGHVRPHGASVT